MNNITIYLVFFIHRQIKNRHGYFLSILCDGTVKGVLDEESTNNSNTNSTILEFTPTEPPGAYRIKGIASNLYLSMDSKGKLYGEADRSNGATVFAEHSQVNNFKFILNHQLNFMHG